MVEGVVGCVPVGTRVEVTVGVGSSVVVGVCDDEAEPESVYDTDNETVGGRDSDTVVEGVGGRVAVGGREAVVDRGADTDTV